MCRDCHNFLKIVSLMSNREIIVKDRWLIHKFSNGLCSCAEFPGLL
ncbi:Pentatricopeptide repeat-containing protein DWY1, chloroplastic [Linum perenne]